MARNMMKFAAVLFSFMPVIFTASIPEPATTLGLMRFKGTIHGVPFQGNGTAQHIYETFTAAHPDVVAEYNSKNPPIGSAEADKAATTALLQARQATSLTKRTVQLPPLCCPVKGQLWWANADQRVINQGISYLQAHQGDCWVDQNNYARISCSWSAAILWYNDNTYSVERSCSALAQMAADLVSDCSTYDSVAGNWWTCGQVFDNGGYNIVVRYESC